MNNTTLYLLLSFFLLLQSCASNQKNPANGPATARVLDTIPEARELDGLWQDSSQVAAIENEKENGAILQAASRYHFLVHGFTYLTAMHDYCSNALSKYGAGTKAGKTYRDIWNWELSNAKSKLTAPAFRGLQVEKGLYDKYMVQFSKRFSEH